MQVLSYLEPVACKAIRKKLITDGGLVDPEMDAITETEAHLGVHELRTEPISDADDDFIFGIAACGCGDVAVYAPNLFPFAWCLYLL
jgi:hypothetical protein